jgi:fructose-1,6-bisphosphatase I
MTASGVTLNRHIQKQQRDHPDISAEIAVLLTQLSFAAKILSCEVGRASLVGLLGLTGDRNLTGDIQKRLDVYGNEVVAEAFAGSGLVTALVSEELEEIKQFPGGENARHVMCVDPVDGSSNTDINGVIGTIFGFYERKPGAKSIEEDVLRKGSEQVMAGYIMYSTSTMLVYTAGHGVHGFTLDRDLGEFLLSHENIRCPARGHYFSANMGRYPEWDPRIRACVDSLIHRPDPYSLRYTGALVADFHRSLIEGGFYFYPADASHPNGKLRLTYEAAPLAMVAEQAGGRASTGTERILDIQARSIHQRHPLVIGSAEDVALYESFLKG